VAPVVGETESQFAPEDVAATAVKFRLPEVAETFTTALVISGNPASVKRLTGFWLTVRAGAAGVTVRLTATVTGRHGALFTHDRTTDPAYGPGARCASIWSVRLPGETTVPELLLSQVPPPATLTATVAAPPRVTLAFCVWFWTTLRFSELGVAERTTPETVKSTEIETGGHGIAPVQANLTVPE
jgi:hypothetical protein